MGRESKNSNLKISFMRKSLIISFVLLTILLIPVSSTSAWGDVPPEEVVYDQLSFNANGNLFKIGEEVIVQEEIRDSAYIVAAQVDLRTPPKDDVYIMASEFKASVPLSEDLFVVASKVTIDTEVMGDIYVAAGNLVITPNAHIHGNVYSWSLNTSIEGVIDGQVNARGTKFSLEGKVSGDIWAKFQFYSVIPGAEIERNFNYYGPDYFEGLSQVHGEVKHLGKVENTKYWEKVFIWSAGIWDVISEFIVALFILFFFSSFAYKLGEKIRKEPFQYLGIGVLGLLALGIGCLFLAFTIIGLSLGFVIGLFGLLMMMVTSSILYVGLLSYWKPVWRKKWGQRVLLLLVNVILVKALALVPIVGPIMIMIVWLVVFGGLVKTIVLFLKHSKTLGD